ncbi:Tn3 family transposase [Nonomuraea sp. NPDC050394]|uniref:Tn3 family transposase n=1 Tax=Nonomuraea sp. NPDC050394 TaxID=3364363 RepID=UPI00378D1D16
MRITDKGQPPRRLAHVVNAYLRLDLPKVWGEGNAVAADGTKYDIYVDNLIAEFHILYGGVAYHHVADNYIALFSRFVPCGVWEAVYIIEGLLEQESEAAPKEIHADTQGQSFPVFGLAHLFGFELLPRIRNFRDLTFHRPEPGIRYRHIDALFGEPINWQLIENHWQDLMKVAISIREGELSSITLLRRLRHDSKRNKIYRAFRELGRVIRTMVLLRYVSDATLRENITRATNMVESYDNRLAVLHRRRMIQPLDGPLSLRETARRLTPITSARGQPAPPRKSRSSAARNA